jgi:hypothetical protein
VHYKGIGCTPGGVVGPGSRTRAYRCDRSEPFMLKFLQTFLEIAVWRKGPQDLPASRLLALLVLSAYVALSFLGVRLLDLDPRAAAVFVGVDVLMLSAWLWLVLTFFSRRQRFMQTITATLGVGALILVLDIVLRLLQLAFGWSDEVMMNLALLRLLLLALVLGRIFMHALDRGLMTGIGLTVAIIYSTEAVAQLTLDSLQGS